MVSVERDGGVLAVGESSRVHMEKLLFVVVELALSLRTALQMLTAHSMATSSSVYHFLESTEHC